MTDLSLVIPLSIILALILVYWYRKTFYFPLQKLILFAHQLLAGQYKTHLDIPPSSNASIRALGQLLNQLAIEWDKKSQGLITEKEHLLAVLRGMGEGVMVTDKHARIILINPAFRKIFSVEGLVEGKTSLEIIRDIGLEEGMERVLHGQEERVTLEMNHSFPQEKTLEVNITSLGTETGGSGILAVFHDITELKRLEGARRDFVANVSHELRTPLTSIVGYTETLIEGTLNDTETAQNFLRIIQKHAQRLAAIVEDLLTISQIESRQLDLVFQPLSLADCAREVLNTIERACEEKGLKLVNALSPELPKVGGDRYRIEQILLNLLDNAVKYTASPGSITISAKHKGDMVEVAITDTGIGIPQKDLSRIFERFYRVDKARSRKLGGTGLGLSIVKHLVQAHNGKVWAESEEGRGSTFYFTLPKAP